MMIRRRKPAWPTGPRTIFFANAASRPTLSKAQSAGAIVKLARGLWTADVMSDPAEVTASNLWHIVAHFIPDAIVVDRTAAAAGRIDGGVITVATDLRTTLLELPGVTVLVRPRQAHGSDTPWSHGLSASSPARTVVDNLTRSRSRLRTPRTLSVPELQEWLAVKALTWGPDRLTALRHTAVALADEWGDMEKRSETNALFDEVEGRRPLRRSATSFTKAAASGTAWDPRRVAMFEAALEQVASFSDAILPAPSIDGELPFFEAYFSNYIEGTEFSIEDARTIIETQTPPARRAADGHDVLGTHRCVVDPIGRAHTSTDVDELDRLLRARHRTIMVGRPDIGPGQLKDENNRVGSIDFVDHALVVGTLRRGLTGIAKAAAGFPRALYIMFVIAEVHPFLDGNGRVARLMMNAELSAVGACRIVIPTVLRNEYVAALRRASTSNGDVSALADVLRYAWSWTLAMPWTDRAATDGQLLATNALLDSIDATEHGLHLELP